MAKTKEQDRPDVVQREDERVELVRELDGGRTLPVSIGMSPGMRV